jgi:rare lipoprotein A
MRHRHTRKYHNCRLVRNVMLSGVFACVLVAGPDVRPSLAQAVHANAANTKLAHPAKRGWDHSSDHKRVAAANTKLAHAAKHGWDHSSDHKRVAAANTKSAHAAKHGWDHSSDHKRVAAANTKLAHAAKHGRDHPSDHKRVAAANAELAHAAKHGWDHASHHKRVAGADLLHAHAHKKQHGDEAIPHSGILSQLFGGIASVYSDTQTASGERMNAGAMTAAHRTLPFGTRVTVRNNHNGRAVVVRINDRGPFVRGRVIDLSPAAARAIGLDGLAQVSLRVGGGG